MGVEEKSRLKTGTTNGGTTNGGVLVAQPVRAGVNGVYLEKAAGIFAEMGGDFERVVWENRFESTGFKYSAHAQARNGLIERFLQPHHTHVWWVDIDMERMPPDTLWKLMAAGERYGGRAIVAPSPYVAKRWPEKAASMNNGGWFYDVGGFTTAGGRWLNLWEGLPGNAAEVEMNSVGMCSPVPAWLYRAGLRYAPRRSDEVEHVGFCEAARERFGVRSIGLRDVRVEHVYLPDYGERWH